MKTKIMMGSKNMMMKILMQGMIKAINLAITNMTNNNQFLARRIEDMKRLI